MASETLTPTPPSADSLLDTLELDVQRVRGIVSLISKDDEAGEDVRMAAWQARDMLYSVEARIEVYRTTLAAEQEAAHV
jgi:hypothetical protein